jgi:hypothetical protein
MVLSRERTEERVMKIRLDENDGLAPGTSIEVEAGESRTPSTCVTVGIWNGEQYGSVQLTAERARQIAAALLATGGGGGDAG